MSKLEEIRLSDYTYDLPDDRIARFPLEERDQAKLLVYRQGALDHRQFFELPRLLTPDHLLVFNDTRVIKARMYLRRKTGALIEILLLHPQVPAEVSLAMQATGTCVWNCMIGNKKKWKEGEKLALDFDSEDRDIHLVASWANREENLVRFEWNDRELAWSQLLAALGDLPLPPYLGRAAIDRDLEQYQTVYAQADGAVAAPTAGLHFTPRVLKDLKKERIDSLFVTLHVSAGTFLPVKSEDAAGHDMHSEQMIITPGALQKLLDHQGSVIPVGTTSMRFLESLYWLGVQALGGELKEDQPTQVPQFFPYSEKHRDLPTTEKALRALLTYVRQLDRPYLMAETSIFILPGYDFRVCQGLITNYHLPESTLILLVAAFIGEDWRKVYQEALNEGYRFLSYGDSSLLIP